MIRLALHHISVIQSLGRTGSISATAQFLGLTQSAISHRIREAERRVGTKLFNRDGHKFTMTQTGKRLFASATAILDELARVEKDLEHMSSGVDTVIRLGAACYAGFDWFPRLYSALGDTLPNCALEIVPDTTEDPATLIYKNIAEIVLTTSPVERPDFTCTPLVDDTLVVVMPTDHYLSKNETIDPTKIANETIVTHHIYPEKGREYETIFKPLNILPKKIICAGRTQALIEMIIARKAIAILPRLSIREQAKRAGLITRPLKSHIPTVTWYALTKESPEHEELVNLIVDLLIDNLE